MKEKVAKNKKKKRKKIGKEHDKDINRYKKKTIKTMLGIYNAAETGTMKLV